MRCLFMFVSIMLYSYCVLGQNSLKSTKLPKPIIDTGVFSAWTSAANMNLSADGNYVAYIIYGQPFRSKTLVIQGVRNNWKLEITNKNAEIICFSADSKNLCWKKEDSIFLQETGGQRSRLVGVVKDQDYPEDKAGEWLAYQPKGTSNDLIVENLVTGKKLEFSYLIEHLFDRSGKILLVRSSNQKSNVQSTSLHWINLEEGKINTIWTGSKEQVVNGYRFNRQVNQLAFMVQDALGAYTIWYYKPGMEQAILKVDDHSAGIVNGLKVAGIDMFSDNGRWLFFGLRKPEEENKPNPKIAKVDIWSYRDSVLNPAQLSDRSVSFSAVINITGNEIMQIGNEHEEMVTTDSRVPGNHIVITVGELIRGKIDARRWWPHGSRPSYWLLSLDDGKKTLINDSRKGLGDIRMSPRGRWVIYWDEKQGDYISFNIQSGKTYNMTEKLPVTVVNENVLQDIPTPLGIVGWYADDSALMIYDNYDIWKIDPSGREMAVNITNGYGRKHGVKLRLVYEEILSQKSIQGNEEIMLTGLNMQTKYNGFYRKRLNEKGDPILLTMGPYTYYQVESQQGNRYTFGNGIQPLQAGKEGNRCWVVMRHNATEYPNYFFTDNFKTFKAITDLKPQIAYNWLKAELVTWKMFDGKMSQGVLYKPENFDPTKKYPVIFNYYEKLSHRLYQFPQPDLTRENINIPWFVSRGYLVFTPDIFFVVANTQGGMTTGEAAYNAVVSAAKYLIKQPYVDGNRLAIQGHSFGGGLTNYLVTHTNLFAAASEMAGGSDPISGYLTLTTFEDGGDVEKHSKQDHPQGRIGANPWERPELYQRNSAVLSAHKAITPLLMVHNKKDGSINFRQGMEMYMALRRLAKPCWLLQYDNSGHVLRRQDALDYTIRLTQFFDHYLKGRPAPRWMTQTVAAKMKGIEARFELDPTGSCGVNCKVCNERNFETINTSN